MFGWLSWAAGFAFLFQALIFVLGPLLALLVFLNSGSVDGPSEVFWKLLIQSITFSLSHAFVSASLLVAALLSLIWVWFRLGHPYSPKWLGQIAFVVCCLPGVVLAGFWSATFEDTIVGSGFWAVVLLHVWMNIVWAFVCVARDYRAFWLTQGAALFEAINSLGGSRTQSWWLTCWPFLRQSLGSWFVLMILWCSSAFTTVLLLAGDRKAASVEVLLFYGLRNLESPERIFLLVVTQAVIGVMGAWLLVRWRSRGLIRWGQGEEFIAPKINSNNTISRWWTLGLVAILFAPLASFVVPLIHNGENAMELARQSQWARACLGTVGFVLVVVALFQWFLFLLAVCPRWVRWTIFVLGSLSPNILAAAWLYNAPFQEGTLMAWIIAATLFSFTQLPYAVIWIDERLNGVNWDALSLARSLGAKQLQVYQWILWPQLRPVFKKILMLVIFAAAGEITFSVLFLGDYAPTLSLLVYRFANRYEFALSAWTSLSAIALVLIGLSLVNFVERKWSKHART